MIALDHNRRDQSGPGAAAGIPDRRLFRRDPETCFVYLADLSLAEDAMQDTFIKAWKHIDQLEGMAHEKAWLMRIAINVCHDYHRSRWIRYIDARKSLEELTLQETADSLHLSVSAVHKRLKKAQDMLRDRLTGRESQ